jgi:hypothetical protein
MSCRFWKHGAVVLFQNMCQIILVVDALLPLIHTMEFRLHWETPLTFVHNLIN